MASSLIRTPPLLFPATARHTATVIFIHGLGDTGYGWADAVENWRRRQRLDEVKFILPHAPSIPITCNMGMKMPGWYDIVRIDGTPESLRTDEDEAGILLSRNYFKGLIQQEIEAGIPAERIVIGGFSQGGAMGLFSGLTANVKLGGIIALSSYLLLSLKFAEFLPKPEMNKVTPIFMGHGDRDQVVNIQLGVKSHDLLKGMGYQPTFKIYPGMGHSACPTEMNDVENFLKERLPALDKKDGKSEL
ncbi:Phospholipase/carboxylesterase/thioesterase [Apodospora peruviana]|uniref:Acyl-protein thioesterase 1 n=1 Tax=Apodospora peruviana TaxID=516989 RepID=A0AAE0IUZ4_9PEZI|nr:Phospholipase/carboxylesterase/thioesterase [Apodospora peruviana]